MKRHVRRRAFFSSATLMPSAPDGDGDGNGAASSKLAMSTDCERDDVESTTATAPTPGADLEKLYLES